MRELKTYGVEVFVHDPRADAEEALHEYGVRPVSWDELPRADAIVAAVAHREFRDLSVEDLCRKVIKGGSFVDVKALFVQTALRASVDCEFGGFDGDLISACRPYAASIADAWSAPVRDWL